MLWDGIALPGHPIIAWMRSDGDPDMWFLSAVCGRPIQLLQSLYSEAAYLITYNTDFTHKHANPENFSCYFAFWGNWWVLSQSRELWKIDSWEVCCWKSELHGCAKIRLQDNDLRYCQSGILSTINYSTWQVFQLSASSWGSYQTWGWMPILPQHTYKIHPLKVVTSWARQKTSFTHSF